MGFTSRVLCCAQVVQCCCAPITSQSDLSIDLFLILLLNKKNPCKYNCSY
jgi:hypothetical protein